MEGVVVVAGTVVSEGGGGLAVPGEAGVCCLGSGWCTPSERKCCSRSSAPGY